ncbi:hypothetical protein GGF37_000017 [Kickxella alabastrina]|nr:hypothetical protein GGF37_000017 [Kickxella alabastrina]
MLSSLRLGFFSPRSALSLATRRTMSTTTTGSGSNINKPEQQQKTPLSSTTQDTKSQQMDRIIAPIAQQQQQQKQGSDKVFDNNSYSRVFFPKQTYHPSELNEMNAQNPSRKARESRTTADPFVALGIDPLKEYKNTNVLSNFITEMGKIKPRYKTGLTAKSQRRLAQAIKRARAFGLMPVTSKSYFMYNYKSLGRGGGSGSR